MDYSHDTVIVGYGSSSIWQFWLVRQSWGSYFGDYGYMMIQTTDREEDSPFYIQSTILYPTYLDINTPWNADPNSTRSTRMKD
jgi:hypothetical protein